MSNADSLGASGECGVIAKPAVTGVHAPGDGELRPHRGTEREAQCERRPERAEAGPHVTPLVGSRRAGQRGSGEAGRRGPRRQPGPGDVERARGRPRPLLDVGDEQLGELLAVPVPPGARVPAQQPRGPLRVAFSRCSPGPPVGLEAAQARIGHPALRVQVRLQRRRAGARSAGRAAAGRPARAPRSAPATPAGQAPRTACPARAAPRRTPRRPWSARTRAWARRPGWTGSAWPARRTARTRRALPRHPGSRPISLRHEPTIYRQPIHREPIQENRAPAAGRKGVVLR